VAGRVGLSQTDLLAMDLISSDHEVTAGQLARELNLTTGAITGLIDRLQSGSIRPFRPPPGPDQHATSILRIVCPAR
jgi:hypothetical protein